MKTELDKEGGREILISEKAEYWLAANVADYTPRMLELLIDLLQEQDYATRMACTKAVKCTGEEIARGVSSCVDVVEFDDIIISCSKAVMQELAE